MYKTTAMPLQSFVPFRPKLTDDQLSQVPLPSFTKTNKFPNHCIIELSSRPEQSYVYPTTPLSPDESLKPPYLYASLGSQHLSSGAQGKVSIFHAEDINNPIGESHLFVVVKTPNAHLEDPNLKREAQFLAYLNQQGVDFAPQLFGYSPTHGLMMSFEGRPLTPSELKDPDVLSQLFKILVELERHGINSFDLKPSNFLINDDGKVTIIDLGLAGTSDSPRFGAGTAGYSAPCQFALQKGMLTPKLALTADRTALASMILESAFGIQIHGLGVPLQQNNGIANKIDSDNIFSYFFYMGSNFNTQFTERYTDLLTEAKKSNFTFQELAASLSPAMETMINAQGLTPLIADSHEYATALNAFTLAVMLADPAQTFTRSEIFNSFQNNCRSSSPADEGHPTSPISTSVPI